MISVVIPNYNNAPFLEKRLTTVINQTQIPGEIIFLDDASTDDSLTLAQSILSQTSIPSRIIINETNSCSVYAQWQKGFELVKGDSFWIAESDDAASPFFLEKTQCLMESHPSVGLVYAETLAINETNRVFDRNIYRRNHKTIDPVKWKRSYVNKGIDEISTVLASRNTIPNASAVLFRAEAVKKMGGFVQDYQYSSDWASYIALLEDWDVAYLSERLNYQRFHSNRLTNQMDRSLLQCREALKIFASVQSQHKLDPPVYRNFLRTLFMWIEGGKSSAMDKETFWDEVKECIGEENFALGDWNGWSKEQKAQSHPNRIIRKVHNFSLEKLWAKSSLRRI